MKILDLPIDSIKPDPKQPRKIFHQDELEELAANIKSQGLINPVEIDTHKIIITGERRWRAACMAGLTTIRCIENDIDEKERFLHQLSENIHHNTMTDIDTARALDKVLKDYRKYASPSHPRDKGHAWLASITGKSRKWIWEKLALLNESREIQTAINEKKISSSTIIETASLPEKTKDAIRKKILKGEMYTDGGLLRPLRTALLANPGKTEELLNHNYKNEPIKRSVAFITTTSPTEEDRAISLIKSEFEDGEEITKACLHLTNILHARAAGDVSPTNKPIVLMSLSQLRKIIDLWLGEQPVPKLIESTGEILDSE